MSEQAGSALGGPPEGEDTHGEAAITVGTVQGARTQASRTLSGSATTAAGDEFPPCCCQVVRNTYEQQAQVQVAEPTPCC